MRKERPITFKELLVERATNMAAHQAGAYLEINDFEGHAPWQELVDNPAKALEFYISFCCGGAYDAGTPYEWGSWGVKTPGRKVIVHTDDPPCLFPVNLAHEMCGDKYELQWVGYGQPDGDGSDGHMWAARIVRKHNGRQCKDTHLHDDLDSAIAFALLDFFGPGMQVDQPADLVLV